MESVSERVRRRIEAATRPGAARSRSGLAKALKVTPQNVGNFISGRQKLPLDSLDPAADYIGYSAPVGRR